LIERISELQDEIKAKSGKKTCAIENVKNILKGMSNIVIFKDKQHEKA